MPIKPYPEIAAARHMTSAAGPTQVPTDTADNPTRVKRVKPSRRRDPIPGGKPAGTKNAPSTDYRRQRLIAVSLVVLTFLAVPTLVTLLVLFG
ncbi:MULTISPECIES: hypothetical protein [unclassified Arthrobacter]|uniref:hypothetical protein n=1 Tax=unclassified Arthrobacter TaxID=235627 RepID=UPI001E4B986C|nr:MULTISPECIES: hypothetical protein [unclassified Arthrobacter]MCC9145757.1 hypothetical protein [Arthrobacter sp. zg-Y919]MDK1276986.1 hypothetical protein [Arthrobacter sp. zg.Y919]